MQAQRLEGGCFCRAIRYRLAGAPHGSMVCHCRTCRGLFAAPVVAWLSVPKAAFAFTQGTPATFSTTPPVTRWFCGRCGTHVAYEHADEPGWVEVATCSLDDPSAVPPTHHSWLSHDVAWVKFGDGLKTFPRSRHDGG
ncbi:MAG: GFA family protein [Burkholderiaceae bacterium]